jgi:hypothetical protein
VVWARSPVLSELTPNLIFGSELRLIVEASTIRRYFFVRVKRIRYILISSDSRLLDLLISICIRE